MLKKIFYDVINMNILFGIMLFIIVACFWETKEHYFEVPNKLQQTSLPEPVLLKKTDTVHMFANTNNGPIIDNTTNTMDMLTFNAIKQILKETKDKMNQNKQEISFNQRNAKMINENDKIYEEIVHDILEYMTNTSYSLELKDVDGETWESDGVIYRDVGFVVEVEHPYNKLYKKANMELTINCVIVKDYVRQLVVV